VGSSPTPRISDGNMWFPFHSSLLKQLKTGFSVCRPSEQFSHGKANFVKANTNLLYRVTCKGMDATTKRIAMQRVRELFRLAKETFHEDPSLARRYVVIARKIAMGAKIRLPNEYRRQVCSHCKSFILPGVNCRVRIKQRREPHVVITCLNCGGQMRIRIRGKKEKAKRE